MKSDYKFPNIFTPDRLNAGAITFVSLVLASIINVMQFTNIKDIFGSAVGNFLSVFSVHSLGLTTMILGAVALIFYARLWVPAQNFSYIRIECLTFTALIVVVFYSNYLNTSIKVQIINLITVIYSITVFAVVRKSLLGGENVGKVYKYLLLFCFIGSMGGVIELFDFHFWHLYGAENNRGSHSLSSFFQRKEIFGFILSLGFVLALILYRNSEISFPVFVFLCTFFGILLFITGSRSSLLSLTATLLVYLFVGFNNLNIKKMLLTACVILSILILSLIISHLLNISGSLDKYLFKSDGGRLTMWVGLIQYISSLIFGQELLFGIGRDDFREHIVIPLLNINYVSAHNLFFQILIDYGIIGFVFTAIFLYALFRKSRWKNLYLFSPWLIYFFNGLTSYINAYPLTYTILSILIATTITSPQLHGCDVDRTKSSRQT